ncbi:MAG: tetratricopeptide repeat protein, partial [Eubacteriales bacterium]
MVASRTISLKKAIAVIIISTIAFIASGVAVGYTMYWDRYDQRPQSVRDQETFRAQVRVNPKDVNAHLNLGWTYYEQGKKEQALQEYKKALSMDKGNIGAMYNIGLVDKDMKNYKEAEFQMKEVLKKVPLHELASFTLAQVYRESKQYDKARVQYQQALRLSPSSANVMAELGMVYEA